MSSNTGGRGNTCGRFAGTLPLVFSDPCTRWARCSFVRIANFQQRREALVRLMANNEQRLNASLSRIPPAKAAKLAAALQNRLRNGPPEVRRADLRKFVGYAELGGSEIRVSGSREASLTGAAAGVDTPTPPVRTFEQEWRTREDSNL